MDWGDDIQCCNKEDIFDRNLLIMIFKVNSMSSLPNPEFSGFFLIYRIHLRTFESYTVFHTSVRGFKLNNKNK